MKRILIVASWRMPHVRRFSEYVTKAKSPDVQIDFLDNSYADINVDSGIFGIVHQVKRNVLHSIIRKIPRIRMLHTAYEQRSLLYKILSDEHYDLVNFHVVNFSTKDMVEIAHSYNVKTLITPLGSDVLRVKGSALQKIKQAFNITDYISAATNTSFFDKLQNIFSQPKDKFVNLPYGSETISAVERNIGKYSREELSSKLNIPTSNYNICCGYNATATQNHNDIIKAIVDNKDILPLDCQLIIPLTYGGDKDNILSQIAPVLKENKLRAVYFKEFMTTEQVSYLRLLTDLFIHVQTTDAANATIQEFLLAGTQCVNGSWLTYPHLERDGYPYYSVPDLGSLTCVIKDAIDNRNNRMQVSDDTIKTIKNNSWENVSRKWVSFFESV